MGINRASAGYQPGDWKFHPSATVPPGWLKMNGAAVSRTAYAALFEVIGTTWGAGDGLTTFNLPDMRAEAARGIDDGRGVNPGRNVGSAQASQNMQHAHGATQGAHGHGASQSAHAHTLQAYIFQNGSSGQGGARIKTGGSTRSTTAGWVDVASAGSAPDGNGGDADMRILGAQPAVTVNAASAGAITVQNSGGNEAVMRNKGFLPIIKY